MQVAEPDRLIAALAFVESKMLRVIVVAPPPTTPQPSSKPVPSDSEYSTMSPSLHMAESVWNPAIAVVVAKGEPVPAVVTFTLTRLTALPAITFSASAGLLPQPAGHDHPSQARVNTPLV